MNKRALTFPLTLVALCAIAAPASALAATSGPLRATASAEPLKAPVNTVLPVAAGALRSGQTLIATAGTWSPAGTSYAYQWLRNTGTGLAEIRGATASTYKLTADDKNAYVAVRVTAANTGGSTRATSTPRGPVSTAPPVNSALPVISGTPKNGLTLSATVGTWSVPGTSYGFQWLRKSGSTYIEIHGATAATYKLTGDDKGTLVEVRVTATNADGAVRAISAPTATIAAAPPVNSVLPKVSGTLKVGSTLTATAGTWSVAGTTYAYQWLRKSGTEYIEIHGATASTYKLTGDDLGTLVEVRVTATNADGAVRAISAPTATIAAADTTVRH